MPHIAAITGNVRFVWIILPLAYASMIICGHSNTAACFPSALGAVVESVFSFGYTRAPAIKKSAMRRMRIGSLDAVLTRWWMQHHMRLLDLPPKNAFRWPHITVP